MFKEVATTHKIDASCLHSWFRCDDNAVPPVYQLQPITSHFPHYTSRDPHLRQQDRAGWWETFLHLQGLFWQLVDLAIKEKRITSQRAHVYLQSGIDFSIMMFPLIVHTYKYAFGVYSVQKDRQWI